MPSALPLSAQTVIHARESKVLRRVTRRCGLVVPFAVSLWAIVEILVWRSTYELNDYELWFPLVLAGGVASLGIWKVRRVNLLVLFFPLVQITVGIVAFLQTTVLIASPPYDDVTLRDCLFSGYSLAIITLQVVGGTYICQTIRCVRDR